MGPNVVLKSLLKQVLVAVSVVSTSLADAVQGMYVALDVEKKEKKVAKVNGWGKRLESEGMM